MPLVSNYIFIQKAFYVFMIFIHCFNDTDCIFMNVLVRNDEIKMFNQIPLFYLDTISQLVMYVRARP